MPEPGDVVALSAVTAEVERVPVLRGLDFRLAEGEVVGLMGSNGAGKSTFLRVVATLLAPVAGRGHVLGRSLGTADVLAVRPRIVLVGHAPALYPGLTLLENLAFVARLANRTEHAARDALGAVGLGRAAARRAEACSQGMRRRADLARVLLTEPRLLLLDEAHVGLDPAAAGLVDDLVRRTRDRGGGCVVVSHDEHRLSGLVDRVVAIDAGRAAERVS